jgi:hypothetical protein
MPPDLGKEYIVGADLIVHDDDHTGTEVPTLFGIPLNRVVAFGGPYIAVGSGVVADWLLVHVHFLSLFHVTHNSLASAVAQGIVFGLTALIVWLGHQKWLDGFQKWAYTTVVESAATNVDGPPALPVGHEEEYDEQSVGDEAQARGFKATPGHASSDPTVPPGISRQQRGKE